MLDGLKGNSFFFLAPLDLKSFPLLYFFPHNVYSFILDPISEDNPQSVYGLECGGMYDCVYAMAMGMDQTIKANGLSEADLAARKLGSYFNYTAFQNTGEL